MNQDQDITEDSFLQARVMDRRPSSVWLNRGNRLQGVIFSFNDNTLFLRPVGAQGNADILMVYKKQIASIAPLPATDAGRVQSRYQRKPSAARAVGEY